MIAGLTVLKKFDTENQMSGERMMLFKFYNEKRLYTHPFHHRLLY